MPDVFSVVRKLLPGSYTIILPASKALPKVMADSSKHRQKQRRTVGVRMPSHPVTQGLLQMLDRPLLCTSARVEEEQVSASMPLGIDREISPVSCVLFVAATIPCSHHE
jgi:tRNA A37 threonylcarbamoyladenosine synthetase subunit TsaC/SUA5/YrdC